MSFAARNLAESEDRAIEGHFPIAPISELAERESWRKELGRPIYHIHKWWATRLGSVFRAITLGAVAPIGADIWEQFYRKQRFSDKIVLDPFMGSGTTLGEALKLGCSVVGSDINPVSTFLVRQALTPVDEELLHDAFNLLEANVSDEIRRFYQTKDRASEELIPVLYAFWVKEVETPSGERIPLFGSYVFSKNAYPRKKPQAQIICPECWNVNQARFDCDDLECNHCGHSFDPQCGPARGQYVTDKQGVRHKVKDLLPKDGSPPRERMYALMVLRENGTKAYVSPTNYDLSLLAEASERLKNLDLPLPTATVRPGHNTDQARGYGFTHWAQFFNDRQKLCLGLLLREILKIERDDVREQMVCLFSSTLEFNNRFCSFKGEGTGAVRHMFSNHILKPERTPLENSVWGWKRSSGTFSTLFKSRLLTAKRYLTEPFELAPKDADQKRVVASDPIDPALLNEWPQSPDSRFALVLNQDSANLPLPDKSVDAVVTDPPYFDFIHYSELSDFFHAWLRPALGDELPFLAGEDCGSVGEVQHKEAQRFSELLQGVFAECTRVMKDDAVLAFSFHHSRSEGWGAIHDAINKGGLSVVAAHPLHAELRGSSPKAGAKDPISLDVILVCKKHSSASPEAWSTNKILKAVDRQAKELIDSGMRISRSDRFVIAAGEVLKIAKGLPSSKVCELLDELRPLLSHEVAF